MTKSPEQPSEEAFVNIWFSNEPTPDLINVSANDEPGFAKGWFEQSSAKHAYPGVFAANALRKSYPGHSVISTLDYRLNPISFPGAYSIPIETTPLITRIMFAPLPTKQGSGALVDGIEFGAFKVAWDKYEFIIYNITFPITALSLMTQTFILHEGPEEPARALLLAAGIWHDQLHEEIWVFNQGYWSKDHSLWVDVQKGNWDDVILKEEFKTALQKDIYGFFESEPVYRRLAIPWKRGLILYGPPGNGKTISIKVIIKTCSDKGFNPLYVKSFQSWKGEEGAMQDVFDKARQLTPCVMILEDLDSLINDRNRSFFLNQLDGLVSNDGLLIIGTTNHFDRLDPGLSERPSRFDRKYLFDDPNRGERVLYAQYWQDKLADNDDISFPDSLVYDIADATGGFSFAYLKEAFVASLVLLAGEKEKDSFASVILNQIKILRKAIDKIRLSTRNSPEDTPSIRGTEQSFFMPGAELPLDIRTVHAHPNMSAAGSQLRRYDTRPPTSPSQARSLTQSDLRLAGSIGNRLYTSVNATELSNPMPTSAPSQSGRTQFSWYQGQGRP